MATINGLSSTGLNFSGLSTGIDTTKLIEGLTAINQRRIDTLKSRQDEFAGKQATFAALQGKVFDLQAKAGNLARSVSGAFDARKAASSDTTALTASAGASATPGTYSVTVTALAQANQTASAGFTDPNAQIKEGTLSLRVGTGATTTVTIDSRNNTLQGLADAVNAAGGDVRASVINDGSAAPFRLMLTSTKTGQANAITVTNNLTAGTGAAIDPTNTTLQAAGDAQVKLGTGAGALTVNAATNQVSSLIPGVTLNLVRADAAKPLTVSVTNDTDAAARAVQDFVTAYNSVQDFITARTGFDAETQAAGTLLGDRDAAALASDVAAAMTATIPGLNPAANRLSSVGLSFDDKGRLALDQPKLSEVLGGQSTVPLADVKRLFALSGTSNNPGVSFVLGSDKTKPTTGAAYSVNVTSPAIRGAATATNALAASTVIDGTNNTFTVKVNGVTSTSVTLDAGTYTQADLAVHVQQKINANAALAGNLVSADLDGGKLRLTSQQYGSSSKAEIGTGTALAALGFAGTEAGTGTNVAGHFVVGGVVESATGAGQVLTGNSGNANTDGLQVRSTLPSAGTAGVTVSQGLAGRLNAAIGKYLDPTNGRFKLVSDGLSASMKDIDKTVARQDELLEAKKEQLVRQFAAMESAVSRLRGFGSQLSSLVPLNFNR